MRNVILIHSMVNGITISIEFRCAVVIEILDIDTGIRMVGRRTITTGRFAIRLNLEFDDQFLTGPILISTGSITFSDPVTSCDGKSRIIIGIRLSIIETSHHQFLMLFSGRSRNSLDFIVYTSSCHGIFPPRAIGLDIRNFNCNPGCITARQNETVGHDVTDLGRSTGGSIGSGGSRSDGLEDFCQISTGGILIVTLVPAAGTRGVPTRSIRIIRRSPIHIIPNVIRFLIENANGKDSGIKIILNRLCPRNGAIGHITVKIPFVSRRTISEQNDHFVALTILD